jgi:hypothetical protein
MSLADAFRVLTHQQAAAGLIILLSWAWVFTPFAR